MPRAGAKIPDRALIVSKPRAIIALEAAESVPDLASAIVGDREAKRGQKTVCYASSRLSVVVRPLQLLPVGRGQLTGLPFA